MKKIFLMFIMLLAAAASPGCGDLDIFGGGPDDKEQQGGSNSGDDDSVDVPNTPGSQSRFTISETELTFTRKGGSQSVVVIPLSEEAYWEFEARDRYDWCTAQCSDDIVTFTVTENNSTEQRIAEYVFHNGQDLQITLTLTQMPVGEIWVEENWLTTSLGGYFDIEFSSNTQVQASLPAAAREWISVIESRSEHSYQPGIVSLSISENKGAARSAAIDLCDPDGELLASVTLYQSEKDAELHYSTVYDDMIMPSFDHRDFGNGASIIGNIYNHQKGAIIFDKPITQIDYRAFSFSSNLGSITIPESVTRINGGAFYKCRALVAFYGKFASEDHRCLIVDDELCAFAPAGITDYTVPEGVETIGENSMLGCDELTSLTLPNSVKVIDSSAFAECVNLQQVTMPDDLRILGQLAFAECRNLRSLHLSDRIQTIGMYTFQNCSSLTSINIPEEVSLIETSAFEGCSSLREITIPDAVTEIDYKVFDGCSSLQSVTLPAGLTSINNYAFRGCSSLKQITLPENLSSIGIYAFSGCSGITEASIPAKVRRIADSVFEGCTSLKSVELPEDLQNIEQSAFEGCTSLQTVVIPDNAYGIGDRAFCGCSSLADVTIGSRVQTIGTSAFAKCPNLANVYCRPAVPPVVEYASFTETSSLKIYVPDAAYDDYMSNSSWRDYYKYIQKPQQ